MADISLKKISMPEQEPKERVNNFNEVAKGYTEVLAVKESERCLNCKNSPCVQGCPVNVQIPQFISLIKERKFEEAYKKITETNNLPAICGRVCPQEMQCEKHCVRGMKGEPVAIGRLERFVADWFMENCVSENVDIQSNGKKVAIVGAGPAGLVCAATLAKMGYSITVYEALHTPGGVLMYGIPEFRLPKSLVQKEIEAVRRLGVDIKTNMVIGKILSIDELKKEGYEAIFVGSGAGLPQFLGIPGENLNGVYSANEFLTRINLMKAYTFPVYDTPIKVGSKVAVVGGGNVAMDAARCAKRLGAEVVYIVYRRSEQELPARFEEVQHAKEEGIVFKVLTDPVRINASEDGWVQSIQCVSMELGEFDASGRPRPVVKQGSEHIIDVNTVIIAIGQRPNPLISSNTEGLETAKWGGIIADEETGKTSIDGVFAGGDIVTGAATVILAMGAGKKSAKAIDEYLNKKYLLLNIIGS